jgi:pyocin large subunit-like protein
MGGRGGKTSKAYKEKGFPEDTLDYHFRRHGGDFDAKNAHEYEQLAIKLKNAKIGKGVEDYFRKDNRFVKYDKSNNNFLVYEKDGTIITFYKPTRKDYWDNEKRK